MADSFNPYVAQSEEPGALDNRLSLDPNDERWPFVLEWEDGEEYELTLRVKQVAPGEFEVVSASYEGEGYGEEESENTGNVKTGRKAQKPAESEQAKAPGGKGQAIPAILAVIGKNV